MSNEIPEHSTEIAYFQPATPEVQLRACAATLSRLSVLLQPHLGGDEYVTLLAVSQLAGDASTDPVLNQSGSEAARLIDATVLLASAYLFDGMRPLSSNTSPMPGTNVYERLYGSQGDPYGYRPDFSFGFEAAGDVHAVTHDELNARIEEWQAAGTMLPVTTPAEFASLYQIDQKGPYYFTRPLSNDEANQVVRICETAVPDALYLPINLNDAHSCFLVLTNTSSTERTPFMPRTELPQQDFWRALLERGVALLNDDPGLDVFSFNATEPPLSSSEIRASLNELFATNEIAGRANHLPNARDAVRRDVVNLLARQRLGEEYDAWAARLLEGHTRHYERLLGGKYHALGVPEVLFTRSGVSSIDAVFRALQKQLERQSGDPPLAYALGMYYENEPDAHFTTTDDPNAASVMLVNVEPNAPDTDSSWPLGYEARRMFALNAIRQNALAELERAKKSGEEPKLYYLVLDTTTDLLFRPYTNKERIPQNLRIIEVASLTKHQRGERNYFFGIVADYSNMHFADEVHQHVVAAEGELTPSGILHLPRLRESELRRNRTFLRGQTRQFMREFAVGQAALPFERRWQLEGYNYFTYLKPPYQLIFQRYREIHPDQVASMYEQTDDGPAPSLHFANFILTYGYGLPDYSLNQLPNTEVGTSFGLNATRVYHVMTQVHDEVAGVSFYIAVPRICIGLRSTSQSVKKLAETLAAKTSELMTQL